MNKTQQGVQDVITVFLVFALVGFGVESKLSNLVSVKTYGWIDLVIFGLFLVAYFSDVLFFGKTPTIPTIPSVGQNLTPGATYSATATLGVVSDLPANTNNTSTDSTLQPPTV